jgi:hypothetical protein
LSCAKAAGFLKFCSDIATVVIVMRTCYLTWTNQTSNNWMANNWTVNNWTTNNQRSNDWPAKSWRANNGTSKTTKW